MKLSMNIRHALIIGLGMSPKCRGIIDEIYKKDEQRYYEIYIKSKFLDDMIKGLFSIKTEESINKLIGIVESCYIDNNTIKIERIIREFNPTITNFAKNSNIIDLDKYRLKYLYDKIDDFSEPDLFAYYISLMYLGYIKGKNVCGAISFEFVKRYWEGYTKTLALNYYRHNLYFIDTDYTDKIGKLYSVFDLEKFERIEDISLELFLENFIEKRVVERVKEKTKIDDISIIPVEIYSDIRDDSFKEGILKYIGSFSRLLDTLGLEKLEIFQNVNFNNDELNMILKEFLMAKDNNNISDDDMELYITSCIYIYNLAELYKEAKVLYLNKSKEEKYKDLRALECRIFENEQKFNKRKESLENKLIDKDNEISKLKELLKQKEKETRELKSEIIKKDTEISKLENSNKDLLEENNMLVDMVSSLENVEENSISLEDRINYINQFKISLFGGHKNIDNLLEVLSNLSLYKEINRDITSIKNSDVVFVMTDFFNHAFSKKVSSITNKFSIPVRGLRGTNIDSLIYDIYENIKNIKK